MITVTKLDQTTDICRKNEVTEFSVYSISFVLYACCLQHLCDCEKSKDKVSFNQLNRLKVHSVLCESLFSLVPNERIHWKIFEIMNTFMQFATDLFTVNKCMPLFKEIIFIK